MTRDRGPLPSRTVVLPDERLLSAAECGERYGCKERTWRDLVRRTPFLRDNTIRVGRNEPRWLLSTLVAYLHGLKRGDAA